jgi:asparagine synthase (glutamine-hydrolysing)
MCGIAGVIRPAGADRAPVQQMVETLHHRGPDDAHVLRLSGGAFGTARLSIVDIEAGRQPLWDAQERVAVALNGEIYGHAPLRRRMQAEDIAFNTESDTEVVAALVAQKSPKRALELLDGQFALAIWQDRPQRLTLARDRAGQKPLYWTLLDDQTLVFGSELKALLCHPQVARELDPVALQQLLMWEYVPAPRTLYAGIQKLEPGTLLEFDAGGVRIQRWWTPPLYGQALTAPKLGLAPERHGRAVLGSLEQSVRFRTQTDLPVAVLLSGGLDSSAVAALANQMLPGPLQTFSVVFDEPSFDESGPAAAMAAHLGANHTPLRFGSGDLETALDALTRGVCEPLGDGSLPSTWWLARGVHAAGFKIALSGDGADEHFGGYPTYAAHRMASAVPRGGRLARAAARRLPASTDNLSTGYKARRFSAGLGLPWARRNQVWLGAFLPEEVRALVGLDDAAWDVVDRWGQVADVLRDPADRAMYLDQRLYLAEGVLQKVDRAAMLQSLEVRAPFLDHRLIELAAKVPSRLKVGPRQTKVLLRKALADLVPRDLLARPKKGFGTPLGPWLAGPCTHLLDSLDALDGWLPMDPVRTWVDEHRTGKRDHRRRLWTLLMLARWRTGPWGPK